MANTYSPGYPINGSAGGDTVKAAIDKHIAEFLKAYADLTALYQQVLLELQYANVDTVDGKHADNTANNIPLLNSSGKLTNDVVNSGITTETITVTGTASVGTLKVDGKSLGSALASKIKIETGTVSHGNAIPLPNGFTHDECRWLVSVRTLNGDDFSNPSVYVDPITRVVTCIDGGNTGTVNYIIIGLKTE